MRSRLIGLTGSVAILAVCTPLRAGGPGVGELTRELAGEVPSAQRSGAELEAAYAKVLDSLMPDMGSEDVGKRGGAQATIEKIAFRASRPGAEAERAACAKALAARLGADVPPPARAWLLRQLERIGRAEVVPQVAKALDDKDGLVRESARRALQKNPSAEANEALQKALASAGEPDWRLAVINALADRRDPSNVKVLLKDAASDSDDIRSAAIAALAKTGDASVAEAVAAGMARGSPAARRAAADSYLLLAEALVANGHSAAALGMYRKVLPGEGHIRCAGIIGLARAGGVAELPTIFEALADQDAKVRAAAVEALSLVPGKQATDAIVAKARSAGAEMKPSLLRALAGRGDKGAAPVFAAAANDPDEAVKAEAVRGLGMVGDVTAVPLLLKLAATAGRQQEAARQGLQRIKAEGVDQAVLAAMAEPDLSIRTEAVRALAARRVTAATAALLKAAEDADAGLRLEALKALGAVAGTDSLPAVAALLLKAPDDGTRNEAANALVRIAGREADADKRAGPILKALSSADGAARLSLLGVAGRIGGDRLLQAVRAAAKDGDQKVRDAAVRALADWPDAAAAADLLEIARSAQDETLQVIATRGYIRVVRLPNNRPAAENARMLAAGLQVAKRAEEKRQAIGGLAGVRDIAALETVVPCMDDGALKEEAAQAAVRIGRDIWNRNPEPVKAAMQKVLEVSKNRDARKQAQEVLDRLAQKQN